MRQRHLTSTLTLALAFALSTPAVSQLPNAETQPTTTSLRASWLRDFDLSGFAAIESRSFSHAPAHAGQESGDGASFVLNPEIHREWARGDHAFTFEPFLRLDSVDTERSHFDIRELAYRRSWSRWEMTLGISRVFWGVTESQHLVDIVNQSDLVENLDGEDKLGQPMLRLTAIRNWGIVDAFILPGFRERTFPGVEGRLRPGLPIDLDSPLYESGDEEEHTDWALRYSHALGAFDFGLSHFSGTSREPLLLPTVTSSEAKLTPYYPLINQTALDLQATLGSWLLKTEVIHRTGFEGPSTAGGPAGTPPPDFTAATYGFEFTFWSAFNTNIDVGLIGEHLWDERDHLATTPFQNDLFTGTRLAFNDAQSTTILGGVISDLDNSAQLFLIEASRRFGSNWFVELEYRGFSGQRPTDPLASLQADDYFQFSVQRHF
jgi:hypothetical protein